jgi:hypothetical protein
MEQQRKNITIDKSFSYDEFTDWKETLADAFTALHRCTVDKLSPGEQYSISLCLCELNRRLNEDSEAWVKAD